jgi:hypothetical protein
VERLAIVRNGAHRNWRVELLPRLGSLLMALHLLLLESAEVEACNVLWHYRRVVQQPRTVDAGPLQLCWFEHCCRSMVPAGGEACSMVLMASAAMSLPAPTGDHRRSKLLLCQLLGRTKQGKA